MFPTLFTDLRLPVAFHSCLLTSRVDRHVNLFLVYWLQRPADLHTGTAPKPDVVGPFFTFALVDLIAVDGARSRAVLRRRWSQLADCTNVRSRGVTMPVQQDPSGVGGHSTSQGIYSEPRERKENADKNNGDTTSAHICIRFNCIRNLPVHSTMFQSTLLESSRNIYTVPALLKNLPECSGSFWKDLDILGNVRNVLIPYMVVPSNYMSCHAYSTT